MLKKGRKREAKGLAVLYFIIGLIILLIILAVIYFALKDLDWSNGNPDLERASHNYTVPSASPLATAEAGIVNEGGEIVPVDVDLTEPTPSPTPTASPSPTPSPTPVPTPEPTPIPEELLAQPITDGLPSSMPNTASENGAIGISRCYVSPADDNHIMYLAGYGYVDEEAFNGAQARSYLVITQKSSGDYVAYPLTLNNGVSGFTHSAAVCENPTACDYELYIDVSKYKEDIYDLALVIRYLTDGSDKVHNAYYPFSSDVSFTVLDGQVITPVATVDFE